MNDIVAQIFGYTVLIISVLLFVWEVYVFNKADEDVPWLHNPARLKRRLVMAFLLLCVGLLIVGEANGLITLNTVRRLVVYLSLLTGIAFLLLILSVRDMGEMARNAERHAINDLKTALADNQPAKDKRLTEE